MKYKSDVSGISSQGRVRDYMNYPEHRDLHETYLNNSNVKDMSVGSHRIISNSNNRNETKRSVLSMESGARSSPHGFMGERIPVTAWTDKSFRAHGQGQGQGQGQDRYQRSSGHVCSVRKIYREK